MESSEAYNLDGSLSLPVLNQFGFQADGLFTRIDDLDFYGGAGHFFWRHPDDGLLGLSGGYLGRDGVDTFQVGAEGEYYLGRFTLSAFAGVGSISYDVAVPFIDSNPTRFIGRLSVDFYPTDDLRVGASYVTAFDDNLGKVEAEYQTPIRGLAITAEGAWGDYDYDHWLIGVRYYFGGNKPLRDRQRKDDPRSLMPQILHGLGLYGAEFNRKGQEYFSDSSGLGTYGFSWDYGFGVSKQKDIGIAIIGPPP
jgi:hypothetical protein